MSGPNSESGPNFMSMPDRSGSVGEDRGKSLRRAAYVLLALTSIAHMTGRVCRVRAVHLERQVVVVDQRAERDGQPKTQSQLVASPLLSANDRSRWSTIRALVDHGTFAIDQVVLAPDTRRRDPSWYTIDMVRHRGHDAKEHYYSSKPPLLPTLIAGMYWIVKQLTGAGLETHTFYVVRLLLILVNVVPLALYFWLLGKLVERYGTSDGGRMFVMAAATWGTFLTTFAVTLNNHLTAAICLLVAVHAALPIWTGQSKAWWRFGVAGLFAAFTAANELPATSFLVLLGAALLWKNPLRALGGFAPVAAIVVVALLGTNYYAHQSWRLPYMHRSDGPVVAELDARQAESIVWKAGNAPPPIRAALNRQGFDISDQALLVASETAAPTDPAPTDPAPTEDSVVSKVTGATRPSDNAPRRWVLWDRDGHDRFAVCLERGAVRIKSWDNWYEYRGSYWTGKRKEGVDRGEPSRGVYAWHMLLGHHGFFSLTPIWLIGALGLGLCLTKRDDSLRSVALMVLILTLVCVVFYVARPLKDRNYGGVATGFRWLFWLIPIWLLVTIRGADWMWRRRWRVAIGAAALAVSVFSAAYGSQNPWTQPWLFDYWSQLDWIAY